MGHQSIDKLQNEFESIYRVPDLFERQRRLVEAFPQYSDRYQAEDFYRLFDAYCQQKVLHKLYKRIAQLFGVLSSLSILFGVYIFIRESAGRDQQLRRAAWEVINAHEPPDGSDPDSKLEASAGTKEALEYLNEPTFWWKITHPFSRSGKDNRSILSNVELSGIDLRLVRLPNANLQGARFDGADLSGANLSSANLAYSHFDNADLTEVKFRGANLEKADFSYAGLAKADLTNACLNRADLRGAYLDTFPRTFAGALVNGDSNIKEGIDPQNLPDGMLYIGPERDLSRKDLRYQNLRQATLSRAILVGADLEGADLEGATLDGADLKGANLFKTSGLQKEQILKAKNWKLAYYPENLINELKDSLKQGEKLPSPSKFQREKVDIVKTCREEMAEWQ